MNYDTINFLNLSSISNLIDKIETYQEDNIIVTTVLLKDKRPNCPRCSNSKVYIHDYVAKKITHSVLLHAKQIINYKARRYKCSHCNKIFYEHNPFSFKHDSISTYTKLEILNSLKNNNLTYTEIARKYNVSIQKVVDIFDFHVDAKRKELPEVICIDEIYTAKISSYKYACVLLDFKTHKIVDIIPTRHKNYLRYYFNVLTKNELNNVKYVVIDMYEPYKDVIKASMPNALICIDSFHVIRQLNEAFKRIRIDTMNKYKNNKSFNFNDSWYYMLKKFHYFFIKDFDKIYPGLINVPRFKTKMNKYEILDFILGIDEDLKNAFYLKRDYSHFNKVNIIRNDNDKLQVENDLDELIFKFRNSKFESYRTFARLLSNWKEYIINSFYRVDNRRLSNGPIEGINSKIKTIIKISNGMRNFKRFRNKCMYSINKDVPIK